MMLLKKSDVAQALMKRGENGINELLRHYGPLIKYVIRPFLKNSADREECLSETVMLIWKNIDKFDGSKGSFKRWVTVVARNSAVSFLRKNKFSEELEELSEKIPSSEPSPEEALEIKERRRKLAKAVSMLSEKEKVLFYRKYYYFQSNIQIAAEMGITEKAVEGRLYRLRNRLRVMLGDDENE